jgi:hypothetical protein
MRSVKFVAGPVAVAEVGGVVVDATDAESGPFALPLPPPLPHPAAATVITSAIVVMLKRRTGAPYSARHAAPVRSAT